MYFKVVQDMSISVGRMLIDQSKEYAEGPFLQHVKGNCLLTHKLKTVDINDWTKSEKQKFMNHFKIG